MKTPASEPLGISLSFGEFVVYLFKILYKLKAKYIIITYCNTKVPKFEIGYCKPQFHQQPCLSTPLLVPYRSRTVHRLFV